MRVLLYILGGIGVIAAVVLLILFSIGASIFSAHVNAFVAKKTLNSNVTSQVFNAGNKIQSQGYFESLHADFEGYLTKIKIQKKSITSSFDQTNLTGLENECVDAAQQYNSAARSISSEAFRSADLPYQLDSGACAA